MKNKAKIVCLQFILSLLIVCSCFTSAGLAQNYRPLSEEVNKALPDAIDLLIELGQLRRAYSDLQGNFLQYQIDTDIMLRNAVNEAIGTKDDEIEHWKVAYEQENKWYKSLWFGIAIGVVATGGAVIAAGSLK